MNPRSRIRAAIAHQEPDRTPIDLGATPSSGISAVAYLNLKDHLGITTGHCQIYDVVQQLAQPEDMIIDRFGIDVIDIGRAFNTGAGDWHPFINHEGRSVLLPSWFTPFLNEDGSYSAFSRTGEKVGKMPTGATFFDQTLFPYVDGYPSDMRNLRQDMDKVVWAALPHSPWDHAGEPGFWNDLRSKTLALRQSTDKALMIVCGCNLFEWGTFLRRIDQFLMDFHDDPEAVESLLDALLEIHLATLSRVCESVGDIVDIIRFGDDLGMDSGPFMSVPIYRRFFKPRHTILCDFVKKHSNMHTFLHSCGSIYRLLPDLIEAGFEIFNPVQTSCREMDAATLKKEFGASITFWGGGADTRHVLNHGTPAQVKEDVKRRIEIFAPGGGFVFNPIHNIMPDVPPENIVAMFEAIQET